MAERRRVWIPAFMTRGTVCVECRRPPSKGRPFAKGKNGWTCKDCLAPTCWDEEPDREPSAEQEKAWDLADDERRGNATS